MISKPETNPIGDFILQSERNLRVAESIFNEWPKAREAIMDGFFQRLKAQLEKSLPGWSITYGQFFIERYGAFSLTKPAWKERYYVQIECGDYGEGKLCLGVWRNEQLVGRRPFSTKLIPALTKALPAVKSRKWWEAIVTMQSPSPDWRKPEVLWQIHTQDSFRKDVAAQLLGVAKLSEKIIDKLVSQSPKTIRT